MGLTLSQMLHEAEVDSTHCTMTKNNWKITLSIKAVHFQTFKMNTNNFWSEDFSPHHHEMRCFLFNSFAVTLSHINKLMIFYKTVDWYFAFCILWPPNEFALILYSCSELFPHNWRYRVLKRRWSFLRPIVKDLRQGGSFCLIANSNLYTQNVRKNKFLITSRSICFDQEQTGTYLKL